MKNIFKISILFLVGFSSSDARNIKALVLVPNNYGANYYLNMDNLERFGWDITLAGVSQTVGACPSYAAPLGCPDINVDILVSNIPDVSIYDCVIISSGSRWVGSACGDLIASQDVMNLINTAVDSGIVVAGMCTGVRVLAAANVINGINVTGNPYFQSEYTAAGAIYVGKNHYPVIDGNIVTCSSGDYFNLHNSNAIAKAIENNLSIQKSKIPAKRFISAKANRIGNLKNGMIGTTIGGSLAEGGRSIIETSDGGFIIAGYTYSFSADLSDIYLIKTDSSGIPAWSNLYGGPGFDYANDIIETNDHGFLVTGYTTSWGAGNEDVFVLKTDSSGNEIWMNYFGGLQSERATSVIQTSDEDYVLCGFTESYSQGEDDVYIIKLDANGDSLWTRTFGNQNSNFANDLIETQNGELVIVGTTGSFPLQGGGNRDIYVIKTDPDGNQLWTKTIGESNYKNWGNSICMNSENGFYISGNADITYYNLYDVYVTKTDSMGNYNWGKRIGEGTLYDYGNSVLLYPDSGLLICGTTKSVQSGNDVYLIRTNQNGDVVKKYIYSDSKSEWANSGCLTNDSKYYVVTGHTNSTGAGKFDVLFLKIPVASLLSDIIEPAEISENFILMQNYPNPFNPTTKIDYNLDKPGNVTLRIFNVQGQEIKTLVNNQHQSIGIKSVLWDGSDNKGYEVSSGIYFYILQTDKCIQTRKMIMMQ